MTRRLFYAIGLDARSKRLLCDDCMYDYPGACRNPARPNATECDEYRKRYKGG